MFFPKFLEFICELVSRQFKLYVLFESSLFSSIRNLRILFSKFLFENFVLNLLVGRKTMFIIVSYYLKVGDQ